MSTTNYEAEIYTEYHFVSLDVRSLAWTHKSKDPEIAGSSVESFEYATGYSQ